MIRQFIRQMGITQGLFVFAFLCLLSGVLTTRIVTAADQGGPRLTIEVITSPHRGSADVTLAMNPRAGATVREIRVLRAGQVVGRLLRPPYTYIAAAMPTGTHTFVLEVREERGVQTTQTVTVAVGD